MQQKTPDPGQKTPDPGHAESGRHSFWAHERVTCALRASMEAVTSYPMSIRPSLPKLIEQALEAYKTTFRRPGLPDWDRGELLALFPDTVMGEAAKTWRDPWPLGDRAGVYFVFGREMTLLYIGKASMKSCMGARLSSWFWGNCDSECKVQGQWSEGPFFVQSLAMPAGLEFEAPALEEYLIRELNPPDNTAGRKR